MNRCSPSQLFGVHLLIILSLAIFILSNEIDDKLGKSVDSLQKALKAKCDDKSIPNGITKAHVKEIIELCAKSHLDNPPDKLKIPEKIYPKKFNKLMSECLPKAKGNLCVKRNVDPCLKCVIQNMIIHVSEAKSLYSKNQEAVAKLADQVLPCLENYINNNIK